MLFYWSILGKFTYDNDCQAQSWHLVIKIMLKPKKTFVGSGPWKFCDLMHGELVTIILPGKSNWRRWLSTVDLLLLTSLDQLILILKILFISVTKRATLKRYCTEPSPSVRVPWLNQPKILVCFKVVHYKSLELWVWQVWPYSAMLLRQSIKTFSLFQGEKIDHFKRYLWCQYYKSFLFLPMKKTSKLERLPLAQRSSLVMALLASIKLVCKGLPGTNALALSATLSEKKKKVWHLWSMA